MKLRLRNVRKAFAGNTVIDALSMDVTEGELICLIGSSGSGKSTLLRCINLLEPIDDGEILLDGQDIATPGLDPQPIHQRIGIVFQSFNLFPHMTAAQNVELAPRRVQGRSGAETSDAIVALFERFGLADHMAKYPDQLSGGQQQRVAIIRALALQPEVMLFDEVTSALDPELRGEVLQVLLQLRAEGMTMILATHEMAFAEKAADRVCMLHAGQIIEDGPPSQVLRDPQTERARMFLRLSEVRL